MSVRGSNDPFFPDGLPARRDPSGLDSRALLAPRGRPAALNGVPDALGMLRALRGRWVLALLLGTVSAAAAGGLAWRVMPNPKFTAAAVIEVKAEKPNFLSGSEVARTDMRIFQSTQLSLIRCRMVIDAALARPGVADLPTVKAKPDPAEWLEDELVAEFPAGSELMRVSLTGDRAADLSVAVNAVVKAYIDEVISKDHNERVEARKQLQELLDVYNKKLTAQRANLKTLAESVGSDDKQTLALKQQMAVQQLGGEKQELLQVQTDLKRARAELAVLNEAGSAAPAQADRARVEEEVSRDPAVVRLVEQQELLHNRFERARRLARNDSDPSVVEARRSLERARRDEAAARTAIRPKVAAEFTRRDDTADGGRKRLVELETRVRIFTEYEKMLVQGIERLENEAQAFNRQTIDLQGMKDEIASGEEIARTLLKKIETLSVELKAPQRGRVIEAAANPRVESPKKRWMAIGMAVAGAFGLAVSGVAWREYRLRRVGSPEEMPDGLGIRLLGTLPILPGPGGAGGRSRSRGRASGKAADNWEHLLVESIDGARTAILRDCQAGDLRTILITSASAGEGKSSLAGHLSISLARTGRRIVLVDLDLRRPSIHHLFDTAGGPGASEILRGEATVDRAARAVADDLDVIHAGATDAHAIRALGQGALPAMLAELTERYDLVVLDSAPVLPVADSLLISQHVDAVLISVFHEVSRIPTVYAGFQRLAALGVRVLGAVVTGVPVGSSESESCYAEARAG